MTANVPPSRDCCTQRRAHRRMDYSLSALLPDSAWDSVTGRSLLWFTLTQVAIYLLFAGVSIAAGMFTHYA